jgi:hypothetical protein
MAKPKPMKKKLPENTAAGKKEARVKKSTKKETDKK